jgi:hypothetical protein
LIAVGLLVAPAAWAMDAPAQPGSGNNVSAQFATPTPALSPANVSAPDAGTYHAVAPMPAFNPAAYRSTTDCLNAAAAANQPLGQCEGLKK